MTTGTTTQHTCESFRFYFNEAACTAKHTSRRSSRKVPLCVNEPIAEIPAPMRIKIASPWYISISSFKRIRNLFNDHQIELASVYPKAANAHSIVPWQTNPMFKLEKLAKHANVECLVDDLFGKLLDVGSMPVVKQAGSKRKGPVSAVMRG